MCDLVTGLAAATFAINAGSAVANHQAQKKASEGNEEAAIKAMLEAWKDIGLRESQEQDAAEQTIMQADRQARLATASAQLSAAESGVAGASVDAVVQQIENEASAFKTTTRKNLDMTIAQLQREKISGRTVAQQRIAAVPPPSGFLTALQIGGAAANATNFWYSRQPTPSKGSN